MFGRRGGPEECGGRCTDYMKRDTQSSSSNERGSLSSSASETQNIKNYASQSILHMCVVATCCRGRPSAHSVDVIPLEKIALACAPAAKKRGAHGFKNVGAFSSGNG